LVVSVEVAVEVCCCVLLIEEHFFLVEYVFREGSRYTDPVQERFSENFQKHLYLIAMQFIDLLRNFMEQAHC
jgi:hypothetical protein